MRLPLIKAQKRFDVKLDREEHDMQGMIQLCKGFHFRYDLLSTADLEDWISSLEQDRPSESVDYDKYVSDSVFFSIERLMWTESGIAAM